MHASPSRSATFIRLQEHLRNAMGKAIGDYGMIAEGDTVMVCLSGGKDSYSLLTLLLDLQRRAPLSFRLIAVNLDQKQPGFPTDVLPSYLNRLGIEYRIIEADTYSIVKEKVPAGKTTCSLCSRLRRGVLYRTAKVLGANKIALGHHRNDMVETFFLNLFHGGRLKGMPPKLVTDDGHHIVIRPLAYCREEDIARYARAMEFPIIPCNLCGSQENLQRQAIKQWLHAEEKAHPGRLDNIFLGMQRITPSHLADGTLFNFLDLMPSHRPEPQGDMLFDPDLEQGALRLTHQNERHIHFARPQNFDRMKDLLDSATPETKGNVP
ncbi:MAG: tRNA 2-thiocytidine(32) synthetase TtcA [Betaproteobacteria bacterium]|jgi:Predicted ATPase of the PP-loop superfamily implicated in cell cycle control|nr:tRNA 2-thiocytidine(32) synthetase TtcA [Betaproteobacteria bacterium]